jgi:hypothetical protein
MSEIEERGSPMHPAEVAARIPRELTPEQKAALARTRELAAQGYTMGGERFDRDGAHER